MTTGRPGYIFGQFRETGRCRDAQHGDGVCCAFAPELVLITPPPIGGRGIVFDRFLCLFISLFVCLSARLRENGRTAICMKFSGKVWSDHGTSWTGFSKRRPCSNFPSPLFLPPCPSPPFPFLSLPSPPVISHSPTHPPTP